MKKIIIKYMLWFVNNLDSLCLYWIYNKNLILLVVSDRLNKIKQIKNLL